MNTHRVLTELFSFRNADLLILRLSPRDYFRALCDQFDVLYSEAARTAKVMAIPLHPFIIGLPYRIRYLDKALEYICSHEWVWRTTGGEVRIGTIGTIIKTLGDPRAS